MSNQIEEESMSEQELTFGGRAVDLTFNPSSNPGVDAINKSAANFIDQICGPSGENLVVVTEKQGQKIMSLDEAGEIIAMRKLALRAAQEAQMWAVKAATRK